MQTCLCYLNRKAVVVKDIISELFIYIGRTGLLGQVHKAKFVHISKTKRVTGESRQYLLFFS